MSSNISLLLKVPKPNNVFCIPEKRVKLPEILIYLRERGGRENPVALAPG